MTGSVVVAGSLTGTRINLGGGADSLNIDATTGGAFGTIVGGSGKDSITFSADLADTGYTMGQTIGFANFSDSTADGMDLVKFTHTDATGEDTGSFTTFNIGMIGLGSAETAEAPSLNSATIGSGVATFSSVTSVTDRISKVDALIGTEGQYAVFTDASASILSVHSGWYQRRHRDQVCQHRCRWSHWPEDQRRRWFFLHDHHRSSLIS